METTGNELLDSKIQEWLKWDKNLATSSSVKELLKNKDVPALEKLFSTRLAFGTAGLRGVMGPGYAAMNDLVIIQTSQGLAKYLESVDPHVKEQGVVIGFDARYNSHRFAQLASVAFLQLDIPVNLFSSITPTPFIPFTVLQLNCSCGIMVTASHNPKEDNGYKVYWNNGAQIISPHDKGIQASIEKNLCPWPSAWDISLTETNALCQDPLKEIEEKYFEALKEKILDRCINSNCPLVFTYTAMHGVSHRFMTKAFQECGFKHFIPVKEQMEPDPDFPTVKFPNPEEGKSALDLSVQTANANNSTVILANDPDADRLAVAEKNNGKWKVFTGNEIGALLGAWLWYAFEEKKTNIKASDVYMISSTVSSKILKSIALEKGFNFVETLTGFKWMANKACELMAKGKTVLFAFEEAIGFMCGTTVLDKDGVGAAMAVAELCAHLHARGLTLTSELENIYKQYGYHVSNNSYYICHDQVVINGMFDRLRNFNDPNSYPTILGPYKIVGIRDLTTGYDNTQRDDKAILPTSKSSHMITFYFANGCVATLRTSGTEPKIKYYTELCAKPSQNNWNELKEDLGKLVDLMVEEWMQPKKNNLIPRSN